MNNLKVKAEITTSDVSHSDLQLCLPSSSVVEGRVVWFLSGVSVAVRAQCPSKAL